MFYGHQDINHNSMCSAVLVHGLYMVKSMDSNSKYGFEFQVLNYLKWVNFDTESKWILTDIL